MTALTDAFVREVARETDLLKVIAAKTAWRNGNLVGVCPFCKSYNFHVNPVERLYHCTACGTSGDAFRFMMKTEGCSFQEAVRLVAALCGVQFEERELGMKIEHIRISDIDYSRIQNPKRHGPQAIGPLRASIEKNGQLVPVLVSRHATNGKPYTAADGHRRLESLRSLGRETAACIVVSYEDYLAFATTNGTARPQIGADWFYGWAQLEESKRGEWMKLVPFRTRAHIGNCVSIFGRERALELARTGAVSPAISTSIYSIHAGIAGRLGASIVSHREIGEWVIQHGTGAKNVVSNNPSVKFLRRLASRIKHMQPFPRSEWF